VDVTAEDAEEAEEKQCRSLVPPPRRGPRDDREISDIRQARLGCDGGSVLSFLCVLRGQIPPLPAPTPHSLFPISYSVPCSLFPIPYLRPAPSRKRLGFCSLFPIPCSLFPDRGSDEERGGM